MFEYQLALSARAQNPVFFFPIVVFFLKSLKGIKLNSHIVSATNDQQTSPYDKNTSKFSVTNSHILIFCIS